MAGDPKLRRRTIEKLRKLLIKLKSEISARGQFKAQFIVQQLPETSLSIPQSRTTINTRGIGIQKPIFFIKTQNRISYFRHSLWNLIVDSYSLFDCEANHRIQLHFCATHAILPCSYSRVCKILNWGLLGTVKLASHNTIIKTREFGRRDCNGRA